MADKPVWTRAEEDGYLDAYARRPFNLSNRNPDYKKGFDRGARDRKRVDERFPFLNKPYTPRPLTWP